MTLTNALIIFSMNNIIVSLGLSPDDDNVCRIRNKLYCCFNFHEVDGICKECPIGTLSEDGLECIPCSPGAYGYQCAGTCDCEECDHVTGCVTTESGKTTTELFETSALFDPSRHFNTNGSTLNNLSGDTNTNMLNILGMSILGLLVGLTGGVMLMIIVKRIQTKQSHISENMSVEAQDEYHRYHEIDEIDVHVPAIRHSNCNSYLSVVHEPSSTNSSSSDDFSLSGRDQDNAEDQSYQYDYCDVESSIKLSEEYETETNSPNKNKESCAINGTRDDDVSDSLNPTEWNSYEKPSANVDIHEYEKRVPVGMSTSFVDSLATSLDGGKLENETDALKTTKRDSYEKMTAYVDIHEYEKRISVVQNSGTTEIEN